MNKKNDPKAAHFTPLTDDDLEQVSGGAGKGLGANVMSAIDNVGASVVDGWVHNGIAGIAENGFGAVSSAASSLANGFNQGAHGDLSGYNGFGQNFIDGAHASAQEIATGVANYGALGGAGLATAEAIGLAEFVPGVAPVTAGAFAVDVVGGGLANAITPEVVGTALGQLAAPVVHVGEALYDGAAAVYGWATGSGTSGSPGETYVPAAMGEHGEIIDGSFGNPEMSDYESSVVTTEGFDHGGSEGGFAGDNSDFHNPDMSDYGNSVVTTEGFDHGDVGGGAPDHGDYGGGESNMGGFSGTGFGGGESDMGGFDGGGADFHDPQMSDYSNSVVTTDMGGGGGGGGGSYSDSGGSYAGGSIDNGSGGGAGFGNNGAGDPSSYSMDGGGSGGSYV